MAAARMAETLAQGLAAACRERGVRRAFGVPGGASSLDVIDAFAADGIDFVLTHGETAATLMAAVTAELGGAPGVVVTGVGPGAASMPSTASPTPRWSAHPCCSSPMRWRRRRRATTRCTSASTSAPSSRRWSRAMTGPSRATGRTGSARVLDTAMAHPAGPVQLDLTTAAATALATGTAAPEAKRRKTATKAAKTFDLVALAEARGLLAEAQRPLIVAGMEARSRAASAALRVLVQSLGCPVMTTYKAKGAVADADPLVVGCFTGASADARCLDRADLLIFFGLDPIELLPGPWRFEGPILALAAHAGYDYPAAPAAVLTGPLDRSAVALIEDAQPVAGRSLRSPRSAAGFARALPWSARAGARPRTW